MTDRWIVVTVPGDRDDGSDAGHHVRDRSGRSKKIGVGQQAADDAICEALRLNGRA